MRHSLKPSCANVKELTTPDRAIQAISSSIPRDTQILVFDMIFRGAGRHMRLMMLHPYERQAAPLRPLGGSVVGMKIANNGRGFETVEPAQILDRPLEGTASLDRIQIPDVLAQE